MQFQIKFSSDAVRELNQFPARERASLIKGIRSRLARDADKESKRKTKLTHDRAHYFALGIHDYHIFYTINRSAVRIIHIWKDHELLVSGERSISVVTCDLGEQRINLNGVLEIAKGAAVRLVSKAGDEFMLLRRKPFAAEIKSYGSSKRFMKFLAKRSKNRVGKALEELA